MLAFMSDQTQKSSALKPLIFMERGGFSAAVEDIRFALPPVGVRQDLPYRRRG